MQIEYEKTYLLKYIPDDLLNSQSKEYFDIYLPTKAEHPNLRIRKKGGEFEITKKQPQNNNDASIQHEYTIAITADEFNELGACLEGKRAKKIRFFYKIGQNQAEIDIYQDNLLGLAIADIEFISKEAMDQFIPPDFCLADVTQEKTMAGGMIVGKTYDQISPFLDKYGYKPLYLG